MRPIAVNAEYNNYNKQKRKPLSSIIASVRRCRCPGGGVAGQSFSHTTSSSVVSSFGFFFLSNVSKVRNIIIRQDYWVGKQTQQSSEREKTNHPSVYLCTNIIILINFCITSNDWFCDDMISQYVPAVVCHPNCIVLHGVVETGGEQKQSSRRGGVLL